MYAVVITGGKQYRVEAGTELTIERLAADAGSSVTFDRVLFVGDGDTVTVGTPTVDDATVSATVLGETLGPKLRIFKFKQKVEYRRTTGHRQHFTRVRIHQISASGKTVTADTAEKVEKPARATARKTDTAAAPDATAETAAEAPKPRRSPASRPPPRRRRRRPRPRPMPSRLRPRSRSATRKPAAPKAKAEPDTEE